MEFSSPRITACGNIPQFFPIFTFPMITAVLSIKLELSILGSILSTRFLVNVKSDLYFMFTKSSHFFPGLNILIINRKIEIQD